MELIKIAFGGGCHWCTEAVFQSLNGVYKVEQGWVSSTEENTTFSEAVIVHFNATEIDLKTLIAIHLRTHKSTSNHSMRTKYRSAIYYFSESQKAEISYIIKMLQTDFIDKIITQVLEFKDFKPSHKEFQNYYKNNPQKPFCEKYIHPKLEFLSKKFSNSMQ
ncbi:MULTISPECIES: peptide-methionine (S)-S-oxide reductase [unclassified Polaribacter]|uniref:peptide-methionine (S)-S-oxide reductase n=1 Tax=unclassified Polaribacter TaxID=196858 RepID=UPI0011BF2295|nr:MULTISPECIES: peptide-methionine (S)-S-oxide reductase [unclassified Polaribacter]TXD52684.1 peptide-methionine (S)-S-oxide reductase [Polaribacter sp. IC063]TXD60652.1 peptide-methionine (S)-S-oxide reductase [Polaribacter sp. IC066]